MWNGCADVVGQKQRPGQSSSSEEKVGSAADAPAAALVVSFLRGGDHGFFCQKSTFLCSRAHKKNCLVVSLSLKKSCCLVIMRSWMSSSRKNIRGSRSTELMINFSMFAFFLYSKWSVTLGLS